jgi:hypothetical protein
MFANDSPGSNCDSWSGGTADFTGSTGNWIYAFKSSGGPKNSDDQNANIAQHSGQSPFSWSYASAKGGDSVNPLIASNSSPSGTASGGGGGSATSCVPRPTTGSFASGAAATTSGAAATQTAAETETESLDDGRPTAFPTNRPTQFRPTASPTGYRPSSTYFRVLGIRLRLPFFRARGNQLL